MDELTREFLIESQEGLDRMERCLTDLEKRPEDAALIAEIFRSVHTIKGTTGFLGYTRLEKLSHAGESLLGQVREGKLAATAPIVTALLQLLDGLRFILRGIEDNEIESPGEDGKLIRQLEQLQAAPALASMPRSTTGARRSRRKAAETSSQSSPSRRAKPVSLINISLPVESPSEVEAPETEKIAGIPSSSENIANTSTSGISAQEREAWTPSNTVAVATSESTLPRGCDPA